MSAPQTPPLSRIAAFPARPRPESPSAANDSSSELVRLLDRACAAGVDVVIQSPRHHGRIVRYGRHLDTAGRRFVILSPGEERTMAAALGLALSELDRFDEVDWRIRMPGLGRDVAVAYKAL